MHSDFEKPCDIVDDENNIIETEITSNPKKQSDTESAANTEGSQVSGVLSVVACIARTASAMVMLTTFLGLFINPIRTIINLFRHMDITIWRAVLIEIVLFCFFAISPTLDECAGSIVRPTKYVSNNQKILAFIKTMIIFSLYVLSVAIVI